MADAFVAAAIPIIAIPALVALTGIVFVYGGIVRLSGLKTAPPEQRTSGTIWGIVGVGIGLASIGGAVMLYAGY
jgi:hypothetical protein